MFSLLFSENILAYKEGVILYTYFRLHNIFTSGTKTNNNIHLDCFHHNDSLRWKQQQQTSMTLKQIRNTKNTQKRESNLKEGTQKLQQQIEQKNYNKSTA